MIFLSQPFASHSLEQGLKQLSVQGVCSLMKELKLNHCARVFEEEDVDGEGLLELSKEEFTSMLDEIGVKSWAPRLPVGM